MFDGFGDDYNGKMMIMDLGSFDLTFQTNPSVC